MNWESVSETMRVWGIYLFNFYYLAFVYVLSKAWFLLALAGWAVVTYIGWKEDRKVRRPIQPHLTATGQEEPLQPWRPEALQRRLKR